MRLLVVIKLAINKLVAYAACISYKVIWFFLKRFKENKERKIYWVSQYYLSNDFERQKEIDDVFSQNSALGFLDGVVIFCEAGADPNLDHSNLTKILIDSRLTFGGILKYIHERHKSESDVFIITNSDILLTTDVSSLATEVASSELIALTRYEMPGSGNPVYFPEIHQDTWIVAGGLETNMVENFPDIPLGVPGCDNVFAAQMALHGYSVWNPCLNVKTFHNHVYGHRTYCISDRLSPPYLFPLECCKEQFYVRAKRRSIPVVE